MKEGSKSATQAITLAVLVAALGYFVDIYDLVLFLIVRIKSLHGLGITDPKAVLDQGQFLLSMQGYGLLLGGILWGVLGDKRGRLSVLFGSIGLYSLANLANAFVTTIPAYAAMRFLAGVGLAGELGAGVTLVSEMMPKETRGIGTSLVAAVGILGAVVGFLVGGSLGWKAAFIVGGLMGLALLALRLGVMESGMFESLRGRKVRAGNFFSLFTSWARLRKYLSVILIGVPLWFVVGILVGFSPELGRALGMASPPSPGKAVLYTYIGLAIGDLGVGLVSQFFRSRKKPVALFLALATLCMGVYFLAGPFSQEAFYWVCLVLGLFCGYWAMFVTIASEQFGTNIRATVTTTTPNFVRGMVGPMISAFDFGIPRFGIVRSAELLALATVVLAALALWGMPETYGKDLDYVEEPLI